MKGGVALTKADSLFAFCLTNNRKKIRGAKKNALANQSIAKTSGGNGGSYLFLLAGSESRCGTAHTLVLEDARSTAIK